MIFTCTFEDPMIVEPLKQDAPTSESAVPAALDGMMFEDGSELYAIVDAAKVFGLAETLEGSSAVYACLYSGEAAQTYRDVAPYLVQLRPSSDLTTRLFTEGPAPGGWWSDYAAAFVRTRAPLDEVRAHFRRYTRLKTEDDAWMLIRFWESDTMQTLVQHATRPEQERYFALAHEFCAVRRTAQGDMWIRMHGGPA